MVLGFIAECDLSFTLSSKLVDLMKAGARDQKALMALDIKPSAASYKMVHGLSKTFTTRLTESLKTTFFSLNIDESTSSNLKKVVAVMVSYFSEEENEVVIKHLDSFDVIKADTASIFDGIVALFDKFGIPFRNLISMLMDSCSTMRGSKSGLETTMRSVKAPHLLDVDGDSVHHAHNGAKAFCKPFEGWLERLFKDIHSDFHWCKDLREELSKICRIINVKFTIPERFLAHRFLSAYDLAVDTLRLMDAFMLFYSAFLGKEEKEKYRYINQEIIHRKGISGNALKTLAGIIQALSKKVMTVDGRERKRRIVEHLFLARLRTKLLLHIYAGVLEQLKAYVMLYQSKEPLIHTLNDEQVKLLRQFLALFIKPEVIPSSSKRLVQLDLDDKRNHLPVSNMYVGYSAALKELVEKMSSKGDIKIVMDQLVMAYVGCGQVLQKKMPINNQLLKSASAIDPCLREHSLAVKHLKQLPKFMPNVIPDTVQSKFEMDVHKYVVDPTLPAYTPGDRVDKWWSEVAKHYPHLGAAALALLTCFHGPVVEGAFNSMGDILDSRSGSMETKTMAALQTVKCNVKPVTAVKFFERKDILYSPVMPDVVQNMKNASQERRRALLEKKEEKIKTQHQLNLSKSKPLTKRAASEILGNAAKKSRLAHKKSQKL